MIWVSRLNNEPFMINPDLIELIEETPNTVVTLESGRKLVVSETADEVNELIVQFRRMIQNRRETGF